MNNNRKEKYDSVVGQLKSNRNSLVGFEKDKTEKETELLKAIEEQAFQSLEEVQMLLEQVGETEPEVAWRNK